MLNSLFTGHGIDWDLKYPLKQLVASSSETGLIERSERGPTAGVGGGRALHFQQLFSKNAKLALTVILLRP